MGTKRKEKQEMEEVRISEDLDCFKKDSRVEVSLEDEGFRGSWYTATVLRSLSRRNNNNKLFLEFHTLMSDEKRTSKPLRQYVDVILVRPVPPRESNRRFCVDEEVDAFHNDGWWEGVVTEVCGGGSEGGGGNGRGGGGTDVGGGGDHDGGGTDVGGVRYSVFFRCSREQIVFGAEELRLHREWVNGNWVPPLEEDGGGGVPPPPAHQTNAR